jgi:hypothetical protein
MKSYLYFFSLLFSLQGAAQSAISINTDSLAQIKRERYTLSYPKSWGLDTSKLFGMDLLLRSPKVDSLDQFVENLNVFVQDLHGQNYTLLKMGQESENQIKNMVTEVEIIESRLDSTASNVYYSLKYKGRQGKFFLTTEQRYYLKDEVGFALTFTVQNGKEKEYASTSKRIFNSFKPL